MRVGTGIAGASPLSVPRGVSPRTARAKFDDAGTDRDGLTGAGVLIGVWRIQAHHETRNENAHAELGRRIDGLGPRIDGLGERIDTLKTEVSTVAADVVYLRGRQGERDGEHPQ